MLRTATGLVSTTDVGGTLPSAPEITRYGSDISSSLPSKDRMHNLSHDTRLTVPHVAKNSYSFILTGLTTGRYETKFQRLTRNFRSQVYLIKLFLTITEIETSIISRRFGS